MARLIQTDAGDQAQPIEQTEGCRPGCGACCIAPSISSAIPGMPNGKPAGVRCQQLDDDNLCSLFGDSRRPEVCEQFAFDRMICGTSRHEALETLSWLEGHTLTNRPLN